jgi:hypothetical protein
MLYSFIHLKKINFVIPAQAGIQQNKKYMRSMSTAKQHIE